MLVGGAGSGPVLGRDVGEPLAGEERRVRPALRCSGCRTRRSRRTGRPASRPGRRWSGWCRSRTPVTMHRSLGGEQHLLGRGRGVDVRRGLAVVDAGQVAAAGVLGAVDAGVAVLGVVVVLRACTRRSRCCRAGRRRSRGSTATPAVHEEVAKVEPWHGSPESSPKTGTVHTELVTALPVGPAGQLVQAEDVLGAVGGGDRPVLAVVVAVLRRRPVVCARSASRRRLFGRHMPVRVVLDQLGGLAVEDEARRCRTSSTGRTCRSAPSSSQEP